MLPLLLCTTTYWQERSLFGSQSAGQWSRLSNSAALWKKLQENKWGWVFGDEQVNTQEENSTFLGTKIWLFSQIKPAICWWSDQRAGVPELFPLESRSWYKDLLYCQDAKLYKYSIVQKVFFFFCSQKCNNISGSFKIVFLIIAFIVSSSICSLCYYDIIYNTEL